MARIKQWIPIAPGVALYRENRTWLLSVRNLCSKLTMSTKTQKLSDAALIADAAAGSDTPSYDQILRKMEEMRAQGYSFRNPHPNDKAGPRGTTTPIAQVNPHVEQGQQAEARLAELQQIAERTLDAAIKKGVVGAARQIESVTPEVAIESLMARIRAEGSNSKPYQDSVRNRLLEFVDLTRKRHPVASIAQITLDDINVHLDYLRAPKTVDKATGTLLGAGKMPKTVRDRFAMIRELLTHSYREGWIERDPTLNKKVPKVPKGEIRFYLTSEVETVFQMAKKNVWLSAAFAVAIYTGLRLDEVYKLRWDQVYIERRKIRTQMGKLNKRWKEIPIFDQLMPYLEALPRKGKTLFGEGRKKKSLGTSVLRLVKRALPHRAAEVEAAGTRHDGSQTARRTLATHLRALNVSAKRIAQWLGHTVSVLEEDYCGLLPDGERPLKLTFLGDSLVTDGLPHPYPPSR